MNLIVRRRITLGMLVIVSFLTACAYPPRTVSDDAAIRTVAVLSTLDEVAPVRRIGITVFNNKDTTADQGGALGKAAVGAAERRLASARPTWTFRDATAESAALRAKYADKGFWVPDRKQLPADLAQIATRLNADALFLIEGRSNENMPGRGVGVIGRNPFSFSTLKTATVHAHLSVALVGRDGKDINGRSAYPFSLIPAAELGLTYELDTLDDPSVKERLGRALATEAEKAVNEALGRLGY